MTALPMTRARWLALAAGLPVALGVIALAVNNWVRVAVVHLVNSEQYTYPVSVSAPVTHGQVRVTADNAGLVIRTGRVTRIRVRGSVSGTGERPAFSHRLTPAGLRLAARCELQVSSCWLTGAMTVPAALPVSVSTSFGNLTAAGLRGRVWLSDNSGDLRASGLTGTIRLADIFGNLTASGLSGSIRLSDNSGDISAAGLTGDTRLQDSFGNISVTGLAAADVVVSNSSGDIRLTFASVPQRVQVTDSLGDVTLVLPPGRTAYRVRASTSFGSKTVTVPQSRSAPDLISVSNNSGDITITTG